MTKKRDYIAFDMNFGWTGFNVDFTAIRQENIFYRWPSFYVRGWAKPTWGRQVTLTWLSMLAYVVVRIGEKKRELSDHAS